MLIFCGGVCRCEASGNGFQAGIVQDLHEMLSLDIVLESA
jgi:hypothetical protein